MSKKSKSKRFVKQSNDAGQPNNERMSYTKTMVEAETIQGGKNNG